MATAAKALKPWYVAVLAPSATTAGTALSYRPFDQLTIREILQCVNDAVRQSAGVMSGTEHHYYQLSESFFFTQTLTEEAVQQLQAVPFAIVDCNIFHTESRAILDVRRALIAFTKGQGKILYLISQKPECPEACHAGLIVTSELKLLHVLEAHLWSREFAEMMNPYADH